MNFYSEFDPYAAQWLRNLIRDGHIAPGHVDERDLWDVHPDDLREFTQVHLCAGIGLWPYSLRRAGWADDRPIWTASFPCQPFSSAGAGLGFADERHLWPAGYHLIAQCRPSVICGEQVASKDGYAWLDLVQADMEGLDYAMWPVVLPVAGVGGPHERHRQFWVGLADSEDRDRGSEQLASGTRSGRPGFAGSGAYGGLANPRDDGCGEAGHGHRPAGSDGAGGDGAIRGRGHAPGPGYQGTPEQRAARPGQESATAQRAGDTSRMAHTGHEQRDVGRPVTGGDNRGSGTGVFAGCDASSRPAFGQLADSEGGGLGVGGGAIISGASGHLNSRFTLEPLVGGEWAGPLNGFWRDADWLFCTDGKWRPVEPGTRPLAHGLPLGMGTLGAGLGGLCDLAGVGSASLKRAKQYRVGALRGYGNAIVPDAAVAFIEAWMGAAP